MGKVDRVVRRLRAGVRRRRRANRAARARHFQTNWFSWRRLALACCVVGLACVVLLCTPSGCSPRTSLSSQTIPLEGRQVRVRVFSAVDQATVNAQTPPVYFTTVDPTLRVLQRFVIYPHSSYRR